MGILDDKVVLITKVTEFVGAAICKSCIDEGATVFLQDKKFSDMSARQAFLTLHPNIEVTAQTEADKIISKVIEKHGRIDCLVPNDGYPAIRASVEDANANDMRTALEEMVVEPFQLIGAAVPHMKKLDAGRIVMPTSAAPYHGLPNYSMYVTGRGAQHFMIQTLAKELAKSNISINGVAGNFIESPSYFSEDMLKDEAIVNKILSQIPLGRIGKPQEMADVVTFLLSDKAGFVTGHVVPVAGGWA